MYGDQFGEFVCGYWGSKVKSLKRLEKPTIGNDDKRKKLQIKEP